MKFNSPSTIVFPNNSNIYYHKYNLEKEKTNKEIQNIINSKIDFLFA